MLEKRLEAESLLIQHKKGKRSEVQCKSIANCIWLIKADFTVKLGQKKVEGLWTQ